VSLSRFEVCTYALTHCLAALPPASSVPLWSYWSHWNVWRRSWSEDGAQTLVRAWVRLVSNEVVGPMLRYAEMATEAQINAAMCGIYHPNLWEEVRRVVEPMMCMRTRTSSHATVELA
jgi:hypothetical protein